MTRATSIAYRYGNGSQRSNIFYQRDNGETDVWKWKALPVKERLAEISRVMGRFPLSDFGMCDISTGGDMEYIGIRDGEFRSGKGSKNTPAARIFAPNSEVRRYRN